MPAKVKKMKGDNKQIFFRTAYSRFYHCAKTSTFHISKSSTIILSSLKPLWKSEGSGFGWTCPGLMGLNLSSSYWLLSILVKPKPSCIPRAFRGAQLTSSCHRLMPMSQLQQRNSWAQDTKGWALVLPCGLCGTLWMMAEQDSHEIPSLCHEDEL